MKWIYRNAYYHASGNYVSIYSDCWPVPRGGNPYPNFCLNIPKFMLPYKMRSMLFWYYSCLLPGQCREGGTPAQIFIYGLRSVLGLRVGLKRRV